MRVLRRESPGMKPTRTTPGGARRRNGTGIDREEVGIGGGKSHVVLTVRREAVERRQN
jgi:hypothetical protein